MKTSSNPFARRARVFAALCAGLLCATAPAQPAASGMDNRFLLIFDTSSAMKPRMKATEYAVQRLFIARMNGELQPGDTIGVWAFDREFRAGELPLQRWLPQNAVIISSNINHFIEHEHYSKRTRFDVIIPAVNNLVQHSQQLTVLIFCDGAGEITGTPYDKAINASFKQNESAMRKGQQTFIVVLRAQSNQYTGYSVNSSAGGVTFPAFPLLPVPPQPVALPQTNQPPPPPPTRAAAPAVILPPLVIIGTNVSTNPVPPVSAKAALSGSLPATAEPGPLPAEPLAGPTNASLTNAASLKKAGATTNAVASSPENSGLTRKGALATGAVLLAVATLVIILALIRSHRPRGGSLITRAMNKK